VSAVSTGQRAHIRADIQGLRALAVGVVVIYHLRPEWVPGGFIGVDVFFVISGYLITTSLAAEAVRTGTVDLRRFWGRRVRRLMPAATAVLVAVVVGTAALLPLSAWTTIAQQVLASAFSVQNWVLAGGAVSYLHATTLPSPLQHFWSLSVEEQFYIVWPLIIVATLLIVKARRGAPVPAIKAVLLVLGAGSLVYSIVASASTPELAYFSTFTRAWELMLGAALALWLPVLRLSSRVASIAFVGGLVAIVASLFVINSSTVFPGFAALLPTLGAVGVIGGGLTAGPSIVRRALEWRPVVYLGDISYSLYLWHWPLIVLLGASLDTTRLPLWACAGVVVLAIVLAGLSKRFIEDVFQRPQRPVPETAPSRAWRFRRSPLVLAVSLLTITSLFAAGLYGSLVRISAEQRAAQSPENNPGGRILDPDFDWASFPDLPTAPAPDILTLQQNIERQLTLECLSAIDDPTVTTCDAGDPDGTKTVLLAGDSHTAQWLPALDELGLANHWKVVLAGKQNCPLLTVDAPSPGGKPIYQECIDWNANLRSTVDRLRPDLVVTSAANYVYPRDVAPNDPDYDALIGQAYAAQYAFIEELGIPVAVIRETPFFPGFSAPDCLSERNSTVAECSAAMTAALREAPSRIEQAELVDPRLIPIDVNGLICSDGLCSAAIGNVVTYRDDNHLTDPFARSLTWAIRAQLEPRVPELFAD
jgi:peptidoglycan/LPS O-acetylase OafA/YrhL